MTYGTVLADQIQNTTGYTLGAGNATNFKNRIINGAMVINQRGASSYSNSTGTTQQYSLDRWEGNVFGSGTGTFTITNPTTTLSGFTKSLLVTVGTADSSQSNNYGYSIEQQIEGYNIADLSWGNANAKTVTISFWVYSSVVGTFPLVIQNGANTRSYGATYTISSANTWQQISITVAGDTTGTWATDNSSGLLIHWGLGGGGSNRTAPAGWSTAAAYNQTMVSGCVSLMATAGATFYITGVQLEVGSYATGFEYRDYGRELALCQRYYWKLVGTGSANQYASVGAGVCTATTSGRVVSQYPVQMRTVPTFSYGGNFYIEDGGGSHVISAIGTSFGNTSSAFLDLTTTGLTSGHGLACFTGNTTTDYFQASAEL